ncbi:ectonucleotide pyrophosphatase/phosphodiesterase family member 7-like [Branchiostoma floridae]|uniref:Ectonucleotide pyrophosphatase/phosphodiesterase family member 7-like n=1 Tax=Branchiostoma floridae TaxID=7739 RepID=A0A9J7K9I7_BRAFL|nr:ectonucleotide pyrophosphatase/phosphodiesterase family member 7-like [Branchiostoma floridae]
MAMSRLATLFYTLLLLTIVSTAPAGGRSKLLLMVLDGFRWDMDKLEDLPNLAAFSAEGVKVPYVTPAFTTLTIPNIFTILTGCYPETHGVLHNIVFDKSTGQLGSPAYVKNITEYLNPGIETIGMTASQQGRRVGTYNLIPIPGTGTDIYEYEPEPRNESYSTISAGVDKVLNWFSNSSIDFTAFYANILDEAAHYFGPESPEARSALRQLDRVIGYLLQQIKQRGMKDLNVILVADHGFEQVKNVSNPIEILSYVNASSLQMLIADYGPLALIQPLPGRKEEVYAALSGKHPNMTVYYKEDVPTRFHYANTPRMTDILVTADPGYVIYSRYQGSSYSLKGDHGWDNRYQDMKALFRAWGPDFKRGYVRPAPFDSVHIYPLMCEILGVKPEINNGSLAEVKDMLVRVSSQGFQTMATAHMLLIVMAAMILT